MCSVHQPGSCYRYMNEIRCKLTTSLFFLYNLDLVEQNTTFSIRHRNSDFIRKFFLTEQPNIEINRFSVHSNACINAHGFCISSNFFFRKKNFFCSFVDSSALKQRGSMNLNSMMAFVSTPLMNRIWD